MDKYEQLAVVGEGSYGVVMKCRHRDTGHLVAIKKFLETEDDVAVKRMAHREIKMLKKLRHENLVNLLEVFKRKRRFYLVFEYVDRTVLEELEAAGGGLPDEVVRRHVFQLLRAVDHCHTNNIIHRDVKPENVLVSRLGVVKLCDFGFARVTSRSGDPYTEYVATRWYRAPELLIGDPKYGPEVDIWAIGCLFAEMMTGDPLFPGESDIDQLYLIVKLIGRLSNRQLQLLARRPQMREATLEVVASGVGGGGAGRSLRRLLPSRRAPALSLLATTLRPEPSRRPPCRELLRHVYFTHDGFADQFPVELRRRANQEAQANPLLRKWQGTSANRGKRESINDDILPKANIIEAPSIQNKQEQQPNIHRPRSKLKMSENNTINSREPSEKERQRNPPPSPVGFAASPLNVSNSVHLNRRLTQNSPHIKINHPKLKMQASINSIPLQFNYTTKHQTDKRFENKSDMMESKFNKTIEINQVNKVKRINQEFILPSVSGGKNVSATLSPLRSSKIKLLPLENLLNVPGFRRDSDTNSPGNRATPTSLPYM